MRIKEEFHLIGGTKVEIVSNVQPEFDAYVETMTSSIFTETLIDGKQAKYIFLKSSSEKRHVAIKITDISAYNATSLD